MRLTKHINFKSSKNLADIVLHCENNNLVDSNFPRLNNYLNAIFQALLIALKQFESKNRQSTP